MRIPNFDVKNSSELDHSLFSQLDPLLGYTHNENYKPKENDHELLVYFSNEDYIHFKNGFVGLNYKTNENPVSIVILGSSSSDPYLFSGNWPLQFHRLLVKKNIPHVIYNGAVSGYNSHQILTKTIRDVFNLPKVDLVISYFGGNDLIDNEDIVKNHPTTHPYLLTLFETLSVTNNADLPLFEKAKLELNKILNVNKSSLQLGVKNFDYLKNLVMNIKYMKAICDLNKVPYIHVIEAVVANDKQRIIGHKLSVQNATLEKNMQTFLTEAYSMLKSTDYVYSVQGQFKNENNIFFDSVHFSEKGSTVLASHIMDLATNYSKSPKILRTKVD